MINAGINGTSSSRPPDRLCDLPVPTIKAVIHNERKQLSWKYILGGLLLGFLFNCVLPLKLYLVPSVACTLLSGAFVWFIVFWSFRTPAKLAASLWIVNTFSDKFF